MLIRSIAAISLSSAVLVTLVCVRRARRCAAGWRPWVCYQTARFWSLVFSHWKAENACTYPENGPAIVVANHTSSADPVILWLNHFAQFKHPTIRVIGYMMAREFFVQKGLVGWISRAMESIPVRRAGRDMGPVKEALRRLESGKLLGLFPEGKLNVESPDDRLLPGGTGVAWLALKSRAPVIPVFISHAPRGRTVVRSFFKFTRTRVRYGEPIDLSPWLDQRATHEVLVEVTDVIMHRIAQLGGIEYSPTSRARNHSHDTED